MLGIVCFVMYGGGCGGSGCGGGSGGGGGGGGVCVCVGMGFNNIVIRFYMGLFIRGFSRCKSHTNVYVFPPIYLDLLVILLFITFSLLSTGRFLVGSASS